MNCHEARDKLIELAYGELAEPDSPAVLEHLRSCPACQAEYDALRLGRLAMARFRAAEPAGRRWAPPVQKARLIPFRRYLVAAAGVAAAVLALVIVWRFQEAAVAPAYAQPVEIRRLNVSLTILSEPEARPGRYMEPYAAQGGQAPSGYGRQVTYAGWAGLALVRDQRVVRHLGKGTSEVRFTDVPAAIQPESVRLRGLDDPDALKILEQNYQYDLASAAAVVQKHVGKRLTIYFKDAGALEGELLAFDGRSLVVRPAGEGPRNVARENVRALVFERLPEGLLARPTLLWQLDNRGAPEQQFEVAYLTGGLAWRADYVLKLAPAGVAPKDWPPVILDAADLVGYATISNNSGVTYQDAQLKLLAGDVNLIRPQPIYLYTTAGAFPATRPAAAPGFVEKAFFEYHLYTLGRATTIRDAETKQIELVSGSGLKLTRGYVYDRTVNPTAVRVVSEFKNSEENGLGKPLPKGVVRLYAPDPEGQHTYVAQTTIDHTPKDEKIRLPWGFAFDIACSARQSGGGRSGTRVSETWEYSLRNHKTCDVTITVIVRVPPATFRATCTRGGKDYPWHVREVGVVEIEVPVKSDASETIVFGFDHDNASGGGLRSPHDRKEK